MAIFRYRFQHFETSGRLNKETIARESDQATRDYGRKFANEVLRLLKKWLRPGGTYNIGASGQAAENFEVVPGTQSVGFRGEHRVTFEIVEGSLTPANRFIREGIHPGRRLSFAELRTWANRKGLKLRSPDQIKKIKKRPARDWTFGTLVSVAPHFRKGSPVKGYARAESGEKKRVTAAIAAIRQVLYEGGSFRPGSNWYERSPYPRHKGKFDYPAYLGSRRREWLERMAVHAGVMTADVFYNWWNSAGREGG